MTCDSKISISHKLETNLLNNTRQYGNTRRRPAQCQPRDGHTKWQRSQQYTTPLNLGCIPASFAASTSASQGSCSLCLNVWVRGGTALQL